MVENVQHKKPLFHKYSPTTIDGQSKTEWPDGTLEQVDSFKEHSLAADWMSQRNPIPGGSAGGSTGSLLDRG